MIIGYFLVAISFNVNPVPVSEYIYPTAAACEQMKRRIAQHKANLQCAPVYRGRVSGIVVDSVVEVK